MTFSAPAYLPQLARFLGRMSVLAGLSLASSGWGEEAVSLSFNIASSDAASALRRFSAQSGQQVLAPAELIAGVQTNEVQGRFTPRSALDRMFTGTRLAAVADDAGGAFAIVKRPPPPRTGAPLNAAAIIVTGLAADDGQAQRLRRDAEAVRDGLVARGIPAAAVVLVPTDPGAARRDMILGAMRAVKPTLDETWLIVMGNAAPGRDGLPMFQVSGPRLSADDLATEIHALPGRKFVVLAMPRSGAFLPALLPFEKVEAVSATAEAGEINEPRFARMWSAALAENPEAAFRDLAVEAADRVGKYYHDHQLGQAEHSRIIDRASGKIVEVPGPGAPARVSGTTP
jgi:hypothetical protein